MINPSPPPVCILINVPRSKVGKCLFVGYYLEIDQKCPTLARLICHIDTCRGITDKYLHNILLLAIDWTTQCEDISKKMSQPWFVGLAILECPVWSHAQIYSNFLFFSFCNISCFNDHKNDDDDDEDAGQAFQMAYWVKPYWWWEVKKKKKMRMHVKIYIITYL